MALSPACRWHHRCCRCWGAARKKTVNSKLDLWQVTVHMCVYINQAPHHASQFGVELSSKRFNQVHIITSGRFKKHLEWFETVVCHAVHCATQNRTLFYRHLCKTHLCFYHWHVSHTGAVRSVWRIGRLPHAVVSTEVTVHCILGDAVAVFTAESTINTLLFIRADELSIDWAVRLVAGCSWKRLYYRISEQLYFCA